MRTDLLQSVKKLEANYNTQMGARQKSIDDLLDYRKKRKILKEQIKDENKLKEILKEASVQSKEKVKGLLEETATQALQAITGNEQIRYELEIDDTKARPVCNNYVVEYVNGVETKQDPVDACGGSYVDILGSDLRYAYNALLNFPKINNAMLFDEPGKMVSENLSIPFADTLKKLGVIFGRQNIIVSHNDSIINIADHSIYVTKINGISKAYKGSEIFNNEDNS